MRILVADDEGDIRSLIKVSLEDCGYSVVTAQNGKEAWDILNEQQVDLAVLDVMMPVMDGFTLLAHTGAQCAAGDPLDCPYR